MFKNELIDKIAGAIRKTAVSRPFKKLTLNIMSLLGRRITGRNPYITKLNSIDNLAAKARYVEKVSQQQTAAASDFYQLLNTVAVVSHKWFGDGPDRDLVSSCVAQLPIENIDEPTVRRATRLEVPLRASFRASLTLRSKKKELGELNEWRLNHKRVGSSYAGRLGVRVPAIWQDGVSLDEVELKKCTVVKPVFGSAAKGVYVVSDSGEIICVKEARKLSDRGAMLAHANSLLKSGTVRQNQWLVEELIVGKNGEVPAADIKCYAFYGKTEIIRYIQRYPQLQSCWFDREGNPIENQLRSDKDFSKGFTFNPRIAEAVAVADRISQSVPAPFMRIDLLEGKEEIVFGEFTSRPGTYCDLIAETDLRLGEAFLKAEERLLCDLLKGKKFPEYSAEFNLMSNF